MTAIEQHDFFIGERDHFFLERKENKIGPKAFISKLPLPRTHCSADLNTLVSTLCSLPPYPREGEDFFLS